MKNLTIEIDYANDDIDLSNAEAVNASIADFIENEGLTDLSATLKTMNGPAGYPVMVIKGPEDQLAKFVECYTNGQEDLETFLI